MKFRELPKYVKHLDLDLDLVKKLVLAVLVKLTKTRKRKTTIVPAATRITIIILATRKPNCNKMDTASRSRAKAEKTSSKRR